MIDMMSAQRNRIHPYKFNLWLGLAGIIMMFAGLTSAYIVKRSQPGWERFSLPAVFFFSTLVIIASSVTIQLALKEFKAHRMARYRLFFGVTALLGLLFVVLQVTGFFQLQEAGMKMIGIGSNPAYSFVLAIAGLHIVHVLGGVVAVLTVLIRAFSTRRHNYDSIPVEITVTYWHFVDILWVYIFLFFQLLH